MAGIKQHDLPRLLLKGFASRIKGDKTFVWQFREGKTPTEVSIRDVGHSKNFYGQSGAETLDEFITEELENKPAECVARVRMDRTIHSSADETAIVDFVHSLVVRTRNLRDRIEKGTNAVLEEAQQTFTDPSAARRWMLKEGKKGSPVWDELLTKFIRAKYGVQDSPREKYLKWKKKDEFKRWLLHNPDAEEIFQQLTASTKAQFPQLFGQLGEMVKTGHNNALKKELQPAADEHSPRYARYLQMRWKVRSLENETLVLGDVAVLQFERKAGKFFAAFDGIDGDVILLPLSHNLLVIGAAEDAGPFPSPYEINRHSAALSVHYFVASQNSEQERDYQRLLGCSVLQFPKVFDE